jgi:hypothetical protein
VIDLFPPWLDEHHRQERPAEVVLPAALGIRPVWSYEHEDGGQGGWSAEILIDLPGTEPVWECEHVHETEAAAWACADNHLVEMVLATPTPEGLDGG